MCVGAHTRAALRDIYSPSLMITLQIDELLGDRSHYWLAQTTPDCPLDYPAIGKLQFSTHKLRYARQALRCPQMPARDLLRKVSEPQR